MVYLAMPITLAQYYLVLYLFSQIIFADFNFLKPTKIVAHIFYFTFLM